jgi:hypothetical protein
VLLTPSPCSLSVQLDREQVAVSSISDLPIICSVCFSAFAVAWGEISAQCARLVGLVILILDLRKFGLPRWENALFWTWLFLGSGVFSPS